jgi:hypothetical protein
MTGLVGQKKFSRAGESKPGGEDEKRVGAALLIQPTTVFLIS